MADSSKIDTIKKKILNELKLIRDKVDNFNIEKKKKIALLLENYHEEENILNSDVIDIKNSINANNDIMLKIEFEKKLLNTIIAEKEKQISEMEYLVFKKLPNEFSNFEFLLKKETEIHNKMKLENSQHGFKNEDLILELKQMIKIYKDAADIDISKTDDGCLLIIFKNLLENKKDAYIILEVKNGYKVIDIYPKINITHYEEELEKTRNCTLFLCKLAN